MKIALAILCSLLLVLGQATVVATPMAGADAVQKCCGCGGKMHCCVAKSSSASQPLPVAVLPSGSQNQIAAPVPTVLVFVLSATETPSFSPAAAPSLTASVAPIFARNCSRLV